MIKHYNRLFLSFSLFLFFLGLSFASCDYSPDEFKIYSGNKLVDTFELSNFLVYSKSDLNSYPLRVEVKFNNTETSCFNSASDLDIRWFSSTSIPRIADSFIEKENLAIFDSYFTFILDSVTLSNSISPIISINQSSSNTSFSISIDDSAPVFEIFQYQPNDILLNSGDSIQVDYKVVDLQSTLSKITIYSKATKIITFDSNNISYFGNLSEELTSDTIIKIVAEDKLGNLNSKNVSFKIDDVGPEFVSLSKIYTFDGIRKLSLDVKFKDTSFNYFPNENMFVSADLSSFSNSYYSSVVGNCVKELDNITFNCNFNDIPITIDETTDLKISFNSIDAIGNEKTHEMIEEIFVDISAPKILEFYSINNLGNKDIISSNDNNVTIYLKFEDESLSLANPSVIVDFENLIGMGGYLDNCEKLETNIAQCIWNLNQSVQIYAGSDYENLTYSVSITDYYKNNIIYTKNIQLDNIRPILIESNFVETEDIEDGILKSGELIDFEVIFEDKFASSVGKYFVTGIFSNVNSGNENKDSFEGNCYEFNMSAYICEFNSIILRNGYVESNVTFVIQDIAGNQFIEILPIEIFAVGTEERDSFKDGKIINILNPINRNRIADSSVDAWFTGELEKYDGEEEIQIVNYAIAATGCVESSLNPIIVIENSFYPEDTIIGTNDFESDKKFNLRSEIRDHSNAADLNTKTMNCTLSILKRDATTIYPVELVDISLVFDFYDLPGGDIVAMNAQSILTKATTVQETEAWFRTIFDIYKVFDNICVTINTIDGVFSTLSNVWTGTSIALRSFVVSTPAAEGGDKAIYGTKGLISTLNSGVGTAIKKMCDWVTCRNSAWLTGGEWADKLNSALSTSTYIGDFGCSDSISIDKSLNPSSTQDYDGKSEDYGSDDIESIEEGS